VGKGFLFFVGKRPKKGEKKRKGFEVKAGWLFLVGAPSPAPPSGGRVGVDQQKKKERKKKKKRKNAHK